MGTAAGAVLILVWMIGALGIIGDAGDRADRLYLGVLAVGFVGALWARLRAAGMARTLAAMAVAQASIGLFAIAAGLVPAYNTPFEILALNGLFALLFAVAAGLFRRADKQRADPRRS